MKRRRLGCVNSPPTARGKLKAGFTQPSLRIFLHVCTMPLKFGLICPPTSWDSLSNPTSWLWKWKIPGCSLICNQWGHELQNWELKLPELWVMEDEVAAVQSQATNLVCDRQTAAAQTSAGSITTPKNRESIPFGFFCQGTVKWIDSLL